MLHAQYHVVGLRLTSQPLYGTTEARCTAYRCWLWGHCCMLKHEWWSLLVDTGLVHDTTQRPYGCVTGSLLARPAQSGPERLCGLASAATCTGAGLALDNGVGHLPNCEKDAFEVLSAPNCSPCAWRWGAGEVASMADGRNDPWSLYCWPGSIVHTGRSP